MPLRISIQLKCVILKCDRNELRKLLGTKNNNDLLAIHKN